jgi:hypothetical protein
MWEAVIADMGTSLLAVLNATRTLRYRRERNGGPPDLTAGRRSGRAAGRTHPARR